MFDVGRVCVKFAGRDAGKQCVVVDTLEAPFVMVDGETRRRKVNTSHLIPLEKTLDIAKGADHATVAKAFETMGLKVLETKPKKPASRPAKKRDVKAAKATTTKAAKKDAAKKKSAPKKKVAKAAPEKSEKPESKSE